MRVTLTVLLAAGCGSFGLELAAENSARLRVQPASATDFGSLVPGRQAAARSFVFSSDDEEYGVDVLDVWVEGDTGVFALAVPPEVPRILEPGEHMGVVVRFRPEDDGAFSGELVAETASGQRTRRHLTGEGCPNRDGNRRCD